MKPFELAGPRLVNEIGTWRILSDAHSMRSARTEGAAETCCRRTANDGAGPERQRDNCKSRDAHRDNAGRRDGLLWTHNRLQARVGFKLAPSSVVA